MDDFFTPSSFLTLTSCVAAVVLIMNTIRHVFSWGPPWAALLLSVIVAIVAYYITSMLGTISQTASLHWSVRTLIVVINGCLIYTSAFGMQNSVIQDRHGLTIGTTEIEARRLTFRSSW